MASVPAAKSLDPGESPLHFFGSELRHHRVRAGLTQDQLGARVNYSGDLVSKIETGEQAPTPEFAERCDEELGTDGALTRLLVMVRWAAFPSWLRPWVEAEREARTLRNWQPIVVPGLLQTADYARALLRAQPGVTAEQIEEQVATRLERHAVLDRDEPPMLWFVIDEGVLHRSAGGPKVMQEQLQAFVEASSHTHVTIQVVPLSAGVHPGHVGAFGIVSFDGSPDVVYLDSVRAGQVSDRPDDVQAVMNIWEAIRAEAMPARASLDLITRVMEQWT
ncbi:MAG: helix-turn-helix domain-containing protein [Streptosporangiaceae bacterium]